MPRTTALIEGLDTFMSGVIFGNAFVSILDGQSSIEPHCGPTNLRVRCHMGLQVSQGWSRSLTLFVKMLYVRI